MLRIEQAKAAALSASHFPEALGPLGKAIAYLPINNERPAETCGALVYTMSAVRTLLPLVESPLLNGGARAITLHTIFRCDPFRR